MIQKSSLKRKATITYYADDNGPKLPVLLYCHTFSGNKLEGRFLLEKYLDSFTVCLFDFRGCGNSTEEYVTLGIREKFDLTFVLRIINDVLKPERIYLWGRSMGGATIIHYLYHQMKLQVKKLNAMIQNDLIVNPSQIHQIDYDFQISKKIRGLILDSPFPDSYRMVLDVLKNNMNIPSTIGKVILLPVSNSIKNNVKFNVLEDNKPKKMAKKLTLPACFMIGDKDNLIDHISFTKMFENYGGDHKRLRLLVNTDHADFRSSQDIEFGYRFLLDIEQKEKLLYKQLIESKNMHFSKPSEVLPDGKVFQIKFDKEKNDEKNAVKTKKILKIFEN